MRVLLILTGGTISMVQEHKTGALCPASKEVFKAMVPELVSSSVEVDMIPFQPLIDSSDMNPDHWVKMAQTVADNYDRYDGFVILHGTDTMSYSASALSFMLTNLRKPVVLTGSQLPIGVLRSDARENLLTAIEIAAAKNEQGEAMVPEVCVYFEGRLFRGNRTTKMNSEQFEAFDSYNYPTLAKVGVHITYRENLIHRETTQMPLQTHLKIDRNVAVLKLFPGITPPVVQAILKTEGLRGVVLETFGSGNAPSYEWLYEALRDAVQRGLVIVNKTQCHTGTVAMGLYQVSLNLMKAGVLSGYDITTEALLTKMMVLMGEYSDTEEVKRLICTPLCGEMTVVN
ncbi:MAG: asparaginase [Paludibacteraceae bacterium]|nr:asparaginase [Paludibacteraceae bacterium]